MSTGIFSREFAEKKKWKIDPGLLEAILATVPAGSSVVDLGSGIGRYVRELRTRGYVCWGYDGIDGVEQLSGGIVRQADLTKMISWLDWRPQWCISFETGEHIPSELASMYIHNVSYAASDGIMLSWASLGQRGRNHVNCQPDIWVACEFGKLHWTLDTPATIKARQIAGKGWDRKLLVFRR